MTSTLAVALVIGLALVAANLPFVNERLFVVGPKRAPKSIGWRLVELAVLGCLTLVAGFALEARLGQRQPQRWEFYAATSFFFLTLAFPGYVWRYLKRRR